MQARHLLTPIAAAAFVLSVGSAQAITFFTDEASFAAATLNPGVDTFNDLAAFEFLPLPVGRSAGGYGYTASSPEGLFTVGGGGDTWLSTNAFSDLIRVDGLTGGVQAIGAFAFGTDFFGDVVPRAITLTVTAVGGGVDSITFNATSATSFVGALSMAGIASAVFTINDDYVTLNNLTLAAAIPEPGTYALMLGGLGLVGWLARRRRAD